jgi:hypothetical protein
MREGPLKPSGPASRFWPVLLESDEPGNRYDGRNRGWGAPPPYANLISTAHVGSVKRASPGSEASIVGWAIRVGGFRRNGLCAAAMTWAHNCGPQPQPEVYAYTAPFSSCAAARAAGRAPLYGGSRVTGRTLIGTYDGIACEPWFRFGFW